MGKTHYLKTWPDVFRATKDGFKTFEVRKNDRNFLVGDKLVLQEYNLNIGYTGDTLIFNVTYILRGPQFGLLNDTCIMSIVPG